MCVRRLLISHVRAIGQLDVHLSHAECPGWHVLLGSNGAGKPSVIRSLAMALAGPKEAPGAAPGLEHEMRRQRARLPEINQWLNSAPEVAQWPLTPT